MIFLLSAVLSLQPAAPVAPQGSSTAPEAVQAVVEAPPETPTSAPAVHIERGLEAFRARRLTAARAAFEEAVEADPQSAAAAFYLGYTLYKLGEPSRRMNANKERARELFAKAFSLDPTFQPRFARAAPQ